MNKECWEIYTIVGIERLLKIKQEKIKDLSKELIDFSPSWTLEHILNHNNRIYKEIGDIFSDVFDLQLSLKILKEK